MNANNGLVNALGVVLPEGKPTCHRCFSRKDVKPISDMIEGYNMHLKPCFLCKSCCYELDKWQGFLGFYDVGIMQLQMAMELGDNPPTPQVSEVVNESTGEITPRPPEQNGQKKKAAKGS